ncbi:MAG TPA: tetratricopeptide repeat protein, partial [Nocardiopsis listeri]|uniref:tetratricopeptide repeat protein n=1 Tax=Nocardiopsis listeri TaxID=53440 RepID=UPI001D83670F
ERALSVNRGKEQDVTMSYVKRVMGEAHIGLGRSEIGFRELKEALEISIKLGQVGNQIYVQNSLGVAYRSVGAMTEAVECHVTARDLAERHGRRSGDAEILTDLGVTHAAAGSHAEATKALEKALATAVERDERYIAARASLALGRLPEPLVKPDRARELLTDALGTFEELDLPEVAQTREALRELDG